MGFANNVSQNIHQCKVHTIHIHVKSGDCDTINKMAHLSFDMFVCFSFINAEELADSFLYSFNS